MILSTHAIFGAAASTLSDNPVIVFVAAFISHFLLDAIPHWEYSLGAFVEDPKNPLNNTMAYGKKFFIDLAKTGADFAFGILLSLIILQSLHNPLNWNILIGAVGGVLPDFLQFAYWKLKITPLRYLQRFHLWIHAKTSLNKRPLLGITLQIAMVFALYMVVRFV